jgi:hypothetical protein
MWRCISRITERGNKEPFKIPQMPKIMGKFHLNSIFRAACLCATEEQMDSAVAPHLDDEALRYQFVTCFSQMREAYLDTIADGKEPAARLFAALNCTRLNTTLMDLCHPTLRRSILDGIDRNDGMEWIPDFISTHIENAKSLLMEPTTAGIDMRWCGIEGIGIDESGIVAPGPSAPTTEQLIAMLDETLFPSEQKQMLTELCN